MKFEQIPFQKNNLVEGARKKIILLGVLLASLSVFNKINAQGDISFNSYPNPNKKKIENPEFEKNKEKTIARVLEQKKILLDLIQTDDYQNRLRKEIALNEYVKTHKDEFDSVWFGIEDLRGVDLSSFFEKNVFSTDSFKQILRSEEIDFLLQKILDKRKNNLLNFTFEIKDKLSHNFDSKPIPAFYNADTNTAEFLSSVADEDILHELAHALTKGNLDIESFSKYLIETYSKITEDNQEDKDYNRFFGEATEVYVRLLILRYYLQKGEDIDAIKKIQSDIFSFKKKLEEIKNKSSNVRQLLEILETENNVFFYLNILGQREGLYIPSSDGSINIQTNSVLPT